MYVVEWRPASLEGRKGRRRVWFRKTKNPPGEDTSSNLPVNLFRVCSVNWNWGIRGYERGKTTENGKFFGVGIPKKTDSKASAIRNKKSEQGQEKGGVGEEGQVG